MWKAQGSGQTFEMEPIRRAEQDESDAGKTAPTRLLHPPVPVADRCGWGVTASREDEARREGIKYCDIGLSGLVCFSWMNSVS